MSLGVGWWWHAETHRSTGTTCTICPHILHRISPPSLPWTRFLRRWQQCGRRCIGQETFHATSRGNGLDLIFHCREALSDFSQRDAHHSLYQLNSLLPTSVKWAGRGCLHRPQSTLHRQVESGLNTLALNQTKVLLQSADWCLQIDFRLGEFFTPAGRFSILFWCLWTPHLFQSSSLQPPPSGFVYLGCVWGIIWSA